MKRLLMMVCVGVTMAGCAPASTTSGGVTTSSRVSAEQKAVRERADYWQRADTVSAQYMVGPKAQHQLNIDIAACVAETKELTRLGSIRKAEPPSNIGMEPGLRAGWVSPTRDGPLYTEHVPFHDFDGCMKYKGWDRVDFVRPVVAQRASTNYVSTILGHPFGWTGKGSRDIYTDPSQDGNFNR